MQQQDATEEAIRSLRLLILAPERYEDWVLDDPAGQGVDGVRPSRDEVERRVETLISELVPTSA